MVACFDVWLHRATRPVITCREGQCSLEAKEVLRKKPGALPRLRESTGLG